MKFARVYGLCLMVGGVVISAGRVAMTYSVPLMQ